VEFKGGAMTVSEFLAVLIERLFSNHLFEFWSFWGSRGRGLDWQDHSYGKRHP